MHQTILVAEDDPRTVELLRLYLERDRFRVLVARDGRAAIELCEAAYLAAERRAAVALG